MRDVHAARRGGDLGQLDQLVDEPGQLGQLAVDVVDHRVDRVGRHLADDPAYATRMMRTEHGDDLNALFFQWASEIPSATLVERMRAAGAIPIGRTNLPDLGLRVTTESSLHGVTHNPWHPNRTAGGSSGGEGSALASGMSPLGFGNDIGGSVRNPAYANGIASIKPGFGRIPAGNESAAMNSALSSQLMLDQGVLARHVADVRLGQPGFTTDGFHNARKALG